MTAPADPLAVLLDRACRGVATPAEAEQLRAAVAQLQRQVAAFHDGEEPYEDERIVPTPGQWIWFWNRATPQRRQAIAALVLEQQDRLNHYTWTERIELYKRAEAAEWRAASADRYRAAWQSARARAHRLRCVLADYRTEFDARQVKQEAAIEAYLADGGFTVTRTSPVEQLALGAALNRVAARDVLSLGRIGQLTGVPMVVDDTLSAGEVHLRPVPVPGEGPQ